MKPDIQGVLSRIGGPELVASWQGIREQTPEFRLPDADLDKLSLGYAIAIGSIATATDVLMDIAFREKMHETHRERTPEEQAALEKKVEDVMKELGIPAGGEKGDPDMAIDWYRTLNETLKLKDKFKLRPKNHRILNHTNEKEAIERLMRGEAGFGDIREKIYPEMSFESAKKLFDAHIAADRGTTQSLPLGFMSWFWEQGVRSANPDAAGPPNEIYDFLSKRLPDVDWSKWINSFYGDESLIPEGATFGECMLKLYETGTLNERVFWTSDLGAAVGGAKRRAIITGLMELGVEIFAFLEGIKLGFIRFNADIATITKQIVEWRQQPKYMDMRILAQCVACSGGIVRGAIKGDVLNINYTSVAMVMRHLWIYPEAQRKHYDRIIELSSNHRSQTMIEFTRKTGIQLKHNLVLIEGGLSMKSRLDDRLHKAGCQSTRVRVLASRHPEKMESLVAIYEKLASKAEDDMAFQPKFDALCESWYLGKVEDDGEAIKTLTEDLKSLK